MKRPESEQSREYERSDRSFLASDQVSGFSSHGWLPPDPRDKERQNGIPDFSAFDLDIRNSGRGQTVLLYKAIAHVWGQELDSAPQADDDCVGFAFAGCVDLLACCRAIEEPGFQTTFEERASPESVYALSRIEFAYGNPPSSGSHGYWAVDALIKGGSLPRNQVPMDEFPVGYFVERSRLWGRDGLPNELEPAAEQNRISRGAKVRTYEQARDAVANGYPVVISGPFTFRSFRSDDGFGQQNDSNAHCMRFFGCTDRPRPGLLCVDSLHRAFGGSQGHHDIPQNSLWMDAEICERLIKSGDDSYALCGFRPNGEETPFRPISERLGSIVRA